MTFEGLRVDLFRNIEDGVFVPSQLRSLAVFVREGRRFSCAFGVLNYLAWYFSCFAESGVPSMEGLAKPRSKSILENTPVKRGGKKAEASPCPGQCILNVTARCSCMHRNYHLPSSNSQPSPSTSPSPMNRPPPRPSHTLTSPLPPFSLRLPQRLAQPPSQTIQKQEKKTRNRNRNRNSNRTTSHSSPSHTEPPSPFSHSHPLRHDYILRPLHLLRPLRRNLPLVILPGLLILDREEAARVLAEPGRDLGQLLAEAVHGLGVHVGLGDELGEGG